MSESKEPDLPMPRGPIPLRSRGLSPASYILPIRGEAADGGWRLTEYWEWQDGKWSRQTSTAIVYKGEFDAE